MPKFYIHLMGGNEELGEKISFVISISSRRIYLCLFTNYHQPHLHPPILMNEIHGNGSPLQNPRAGCHIFYKHEHECSNVAFRAMH